MEIRQLEYLVALAESRQFTRAAESLGVAQPSLSQQIAKLERELGVTLVDRAPRGIHLTEAGTVLTIRARRVLAELEAARWELESLSELRAGRVRIGAMQTLGPVDLPGMLAEFHARHPEVELAVREELSETLAELVRTDQLDIAFLSASDRIRPSEDLLMESLASEPLVAVFPRDHRLAARRSVRFAELAGERFVAFREAATLRRVLTVAAGEAGFAPVIAFESNEIPRILALVGRGLGITILPKADVPDIGSELSTAGISPRLTRDVTLVWRAGRRLPPAAAAFLELARAESPG